MWCLCDWLRYKLLVEARIILVYWLCNALIKRRCGFLFVSARLEQARGNRMPHLLVPHIVEIHTYKGDQQTCWNASNADVGFSGSNGMLASCSWKRL